MNCAAHPAPAGEDHAHRLRLQNRSLAVLVALTGLVAYPACGAIRGKMINWDLSKGYTSAAVDWSEPQDDGYQIDPVQSLRIRLPGGLLIDEGNDVESVIVDREKDLLTDVIVYFGDETAEKAVDRALGMAKRYGLDDQGNFERFMNQIKEVRARGETESNASSGAANYPHSRKLRLDEPELNLGILHGGEGNKEWHVQLDLSWLTARSYEWNLAASHTLTDISGQFGKDRNETTTDADNLRMTLPGGREFRAGGTSGEIRLKRAGDILTVVHTLFGEPTPKDAHRRALALAAEWGAATNGLDAWLADTNGRIAKGEDDSATPPALSPGGPAPGDGPQIAVGLHYEERFRVDAYAQPWVVDFVVTWPG